MPISLAAYSEIKKKRSAKMKKKKKEPKNDRMFVFFRFERVSMERPQGKRNEHPYGSNHKSIKFLRSVFFQR